MSDGSDLRHATRVGVDGAANDDRGDGHATDGAGDGVADALRNQFAILWGESLVRVDFVGGLNIQKRFK